MHNFNRNPISIEDNLNNVGKGLRNEQRSFFLSEKDNLKKAFIQYYRYATTTYVSLEKLCPIWDYSPEDTADQKCDKEKKRNKAFNLYGSIRHFVNAHWEALKAVNGGDVLICPICGLDECTEMDHYIPRSLFQEFSSYTNNLIPLCHDCNQNKHEYWLNCRGERFFFNAFFDNLPSKIIECSIYINCDFPKVKISISKGLKNNHDDAVVLRTIEKLELLKKLQTKADAFMRSEVQRLRTDFSIQRNVYHNDRKVFWRSRVDSYKKYILQPETFNFIELEIYQTIASSSEMKDWVENSTTFAL